MQQQEQQNSELFLRPRFSINCEKSTIEILERFDAIFKDALCKFKGKIVDNHVVIDVPKKDAHFWSPQLHFEVDEIDGEGTVIKGLFGPKPQVWTLFMFIHFLVAAAFISFTVVLYVNIRFERSIVFPIVMLIALPVVWFVLYFIGRLGKETGKKQMDDLKEFMRSVLQEIN
ncbi:GTP-binding protein [Tenacibaculum sp. IB213877]|uniref:GTP-binding protein n=1 Tax=Tenacibaculum sp. IB213877 TaxID=3097351 RepID=UPI002A5A831C|nr:GTP-binding protein [Tenacibaculum sp. IB213877]MDY0780893.1 GTP-binding protein [Tenacibaculum sp. IB213877]